MKSGRWFRGLFRKQSWIDAKFHEAGVVLKVAHGSVRLKSRTIKVELVVRSIDLWRERFMRTPSKLADDRILGFLIFSINIPSHSMATRLGLII